MSPPRETFELTIPTKVVEGEGAPSRLALGDCLAVMQQLDTASVDLIYVDPPFATGRQQDGGQRASGRMSYSDVWEGGLESYLPWLRPRLVEMRRLLHRRGSLFLHLDWRAVHYAKVMLDELFGESNFRNEIVWHYGSGGRAKTFFHRKHDVILWYSRSGRWRFYPEAVSVPRNQCPGCGQKREQWNHLKRHTDADGRVYRTIKSAGKVYRYYDDAPTVPADVWLDISHLQQKDPERLGYPTQKPEALLRRIVNACTKPGQVVADFFCGSGTTLAVAQDLDRRFVGCDASPDAVGLTRQRLTARDAEFELQHVGVLSVTPAVRRKAASFRAAVRDWLGARPGPARQRTIHGLLGEGAGAVPLWIPTAEGEPPLTPTHIERFAAAVKRHTDAHEAALLAWDIPDETRDAVRTLQERRELSVRLQPLRWLTAPYGASAGLLQCSPSMG